MKKIAAVLAFLVGLSIAFPTFAQSTINPTLPAFGLPYNAQPIQQNFQAAANDINGLFSLHAGASPPPNPVLGELWLNTPPNSRLYPLNVWNSLGGAWLTAFTLDTVNNILVPPIGGGTLPTLLSATTTDLGSVPQASLTISGNNTIQSFGSTAPAGSIKVTLFTGQATLVQNPTSLILPGATNIVQAAGDISIELALGGGNWQVLFDSQIATNCSASGGFLCSASNQQIGNYTAQASDCSKTIQLAGNAFYTITVGPATGFPANCQIVVYNTDTGRGKKLVISTVSGVKTTIIWPQTYVDLFSFNLLGTPTWNTPERSRWRLPGDTIFYIDPINGTDNPGEDCLAPGTGACKTIQAVLDDIQAFIDLNGQNPTISLAPDTTPGHYQPFAVNGPWVGLTTDNNVVVTGSTSSASQFLLDGQGAHQCISVSNYAHLVVGNLTVQNCNVLIGDGVAAHTANLILSNVATGACSGVNGSQIAAQDGSYFEIRGTYNIIGSANCDWHYLIVRNSELMVNESFTGPVVANITTNLSYGVAFAGAARNSSITFLGFSGSPYVLGGNTVAGLEFKVEASATIEARTVMTQFFPGTAPGPLILSALTLDTATYNPLEHNGPPTVSPATCGGGTPSVNSKSSDYSGIVNEVGSAVTSCVLIFDSPFLVAPICRVAPTNMATIPPNLASVANQTTLTITHSATNNANVSYSCNGG